MYASTPAAACDSAPQSVSRYCLCQPYTPWTLAPTRAPANAPFRRAGLPGARLSQQWARPRCRRMFHARRRWRASRASCAVPSQLAPSSRTLSSDSCAAAQRRAVPCVSDECVSSNRLKRTRLRAPSCRGRRACRRGRASAGGRGTRCVVAKTRRIIRCVLCKDVRDIGAGATSRWALPAAAARFLFVVFR